MDAELAGEVARDLSDAEQELGSLRAALEEARDATQAAGAKLRKRQAEEAEKLSAYERAYERVRETISAERQRLEDAKRSAEVGLRALDAKVQELAAPRSDAAPTGEESTPALGIDERLAALLPVEEDTPNTPAYEEAWYRTLARRPEDDEALEDRNDHDVA
jgi:chromosome segregation ATPase